MNEEDAEEIEVVSVEKLDDPPREPDADETWWEAVIASDKGQHTIHAWATGTAEIRLPEDPVERDECGRGEIEKLANLHRQIDVVYALHPIELRVALS
jgi:hypothetical protein